MTASDPASLKRAAAARALDFVEPGMTLGLGTGSTAEAFLDLLGPKVAAGLDLMGVASSERTAARARALGIPLAELDDAAPLDLTIDGADEADRNLDLIKGGGGALLREKIVASSSKRMIVIADGSKLVERLGRYALPVEVVGFGARTTIARIEAAIAALGYRDVPISVRADDDGPFRTDGGHLIFDCAFGAIADAPALARALSEVPGVVDHGLFIGIATDLVIARADGVEVLQRKTS
jgi:ribose 5-phosphate isomerase A